MELETWTFTVKVTVDREARGGWTPDDVLQEIAQVENVVSQLEGVANVECQLNGVVGNISDMEVVEERLAG
jgi:hypothetical protein